jgi:hypothetical protein
MEKARLRQEHEQTHVAIKAIQEEHAKKEAALENLY